MKEYSCRVDEFVLLGHRRTCNTYRLHRSSVHPQSNLLTSKPPRTPTPYYHTQCVAIELVVGDTSDGIDGIVVKSGYRMHCWGTPLLTPIEHWNTRSMESTSPMEVGRPTFAEVVATRPAPTVSIQSSHT